MTGAQGMVQAGVVIEGDSVGPLSVGKKRT